MCTYYSLYVWCSYGGVLFQPPPPPPHEGSPRAPRRTATDRDRPRWTVKVTPPPVCSLPLIWRCAVGPLPCSWYWSATIPQLARLLAGMGQWARGATAKPLLARRLAGCGGRGGGGGPASGSGRTFGGTTQDPGSGMLGPCRGGHAVRQPSCPCPPRRCSKVLRAGPSFPYESASMDSKGGKAPVIPRGNVCPAWALRARTGPLEGQRFPSEDRDLPYLASFGIKIANCETKLRQIRQVSGHTTRI